MSTRSIAVIAAFALVLAGCGPAATLAPSLPPTSVPRPSSMAKVEVVEPAQGATITGSTAHVVIKLDGARIVTETTTTIRPDEGHVHLYVDNSLVSMNYGLEQDITVLAGTHVIRAEFVAADHAPYNPRVESADVVFTVH